MASLVTQLALWATLGVTLGELLYSRQRRVNPKMTAPEYAGQPL
jgi:hypothetical protein